MERKDGNKKNSCYRDSKIKNLTLDTTRKKKKKDDLSIKLSIDFK